MKKPIRGNGLAFKNKPNSRERYIPSKVANPPYNINCSCGSRAIKDGRNIAYAMRLMKADNEVSRRIYQGCKHQFCKDCQNKFEESFNKNMLDYTARVS